jgi:carbamate kinase
MLFEIHENIIVVAIGGNALIREGQKGTITEQFANSRRMLAPVVSLIERQHRIVITHGNGPQIGNRIIQVEEALEKVPDVPLGIMVADSEGWMGYMIQQCLMNLLRRKGLDYPIATLLTQVIVDPHESTVKNPTKPVGPFYTKEEAEKFIMGYGWQMVEDSGRGYRRVVSSPIPLQFVERDIIRLLLENGVILIAAGGGGIPVYVEEDSTLEGIDGVIDKDLSSSVLGRDIGAQYLVIMTSVDAVYKNFKKKNQKKISMITLSEIEKLYKQNMFPAGSMGPKIKASIQFLKDGGEKVIITGYDVNGDILSPKYGTHILRE